MNFLKYISSKKSLNFQGSILLRNLIDKVKGELSLVNLFDKPPIIPFNPAIEICPDCGSELVLIKTTPSRQVYTLHIGEFRANKKFYQCNKCNESKIFTTDDIEILVPQNCNYGYDIIIYIGESMFMNHLQAVEIKLLLKEEYNIPISVSEVEYLSKKFIVYLAEIQDKYSLRIVDCMKNNGGYILHLDALGGTGGDRLISGLDSVSDIVLNNAKIPSENSIMIKPFLEKIKNNFGEPLAVVQDMGTGIMKAVEETFDNPNILICHFHFLRDLGKDLLKENHDILKGRIQHFKIRVKLRNIAKELRIIYDNNNKTEEEGRTKAINKTEETDNEYNKFVENIYAIIVWILDWRSCSNGYGFPFDRQYYDLAKRIKTAEKEILKLSISLTDLKHIQEIKNIHDNAIKLLGNFASDTALNDAINILDSDIKIFDNLRKAMRIAPKENGNGLNDSGDDDIKLIETEVKQFIKTTKKDIEFCESSKGKKFFKQLEKHKDKLFSDPIKVTTATGEVKLIQPQRTNNIMEQMFREFTRGNKRKTGDNSIKRTIHGMVKDTPLIRNWQNDKFMQMILENKKSKVELFSEIDCKKVQEKMKALKEVNQKNPKIINEILKSNISNDTLKL